MSGFVLSRETRIESELRTKPVASAIDILKRDMREALTDEGEANVIRVVRGDLSDEEAYRVGVGADAITLTCGGDLGAVYGLLSISERCLDIAPMDWWMGRCPTKKAAVVVNGGWESAPRAVRWRGWFVNDEILFTGWHIEESEREATWRRVFETLLRCGGNMVIPGTDRQFDGELLCRTALDMGLWLTQHHAELLGARMFARAYPDLQASYRLHPAEFEALWRESARRWAGEKVVWTVGFRGQGDLAFWHSDPAFDTDEKRGAFISRVIRRQMEIVREYAPDAHFCTNLYGEMMALYRQGHLQVPEEVVKVWGDNGFGRMVSRRQGRDNPRTDAMPAPDEPGRNGVYYHVSFYDLQAANHITMLQVQPGLVTRELQTLLARGADEYWIINVGGIRPHAFFIDLVSRIWRDGEASAQEAAEAFAARCFGTPEAARLLLDYSGAAVSYGPNADDAAGDQFYHFALRALAHAAISGQDGPAPSLLWVADEPDLAGQARRLMEIVRPGIDRWRRYVHACRTAALDMDRESARRLSDSLICMAELHRRGCESLYDFGMAVLHMKGENWLQAYLWTDAALAANRAALGTMEAACHGRFAHYYDNDCFVGVRLTGQVLARVRGWLRLRGDGEMQYDWEKRYLIPAERRPLSQTHRTAQLSDDGLCQRLRGEIELEEICVRE